MVPLNAPPEAPAADPRWIQVEDASAVAACRSAAKLLAGQLGFPAGRGADIALAVTEAASNLHKHARQGAVLIRRGRSTHRMSGS